MEISMDHKAPWLYDVDVDADAEQQSDHDDDEMNTLSLLVQPRAHQDHVALVRCHGVNARGAPCTRTAVRLAGRGGQSSKLYCYRHRHQQRRASRHADKAQLSWCSCPLLCGSSGAHDRRTQLRSTRCKVYCSMFLAVTSLALSVVGVTKKGALLCLAGVAGLFSSMAWMCIIACEILYHAVPPAIAAQVAFNALHAQVSDTSSSVTDHQQLHCNGRELLMSADIA